MKVNVSVKIPSWHFAKPSADQRQRNSKLYEHFAGSGSDRAGDLVREGVQNAGDASAGNGPVRVRIGFGELPTARAAVYAVGLVEHAKVVAKQKGMTAVGTVARGGACRFLTFEDFNTTGLTGDPSVARRYEGDPENHFHTFFRAEGQTDKLDDRKQGSKGVGKVTFMAASTARALFGLTYRSDDFRTLLFGTAVLQTHRLDGVDYDGDAWFGRLNEQHVAQPIEGLANEHVHAFVNDFHLAREPSESGFSIVVPWLDDDEETGVTPDRVIDAVLREHAWPILNNRLAVEVVRDDGSTTRIDAAHFLGVLDGRSDAKSKAQVRSLSELAIWAIAHTPSASTDRLGLHKETAPRWTDPELLTPEHRDRLRGAYDAGDPIAVRVPVRVRAKDKAEAEGCFDVFLQRDPAATTGADVHFIRGDLLISGMRGRAAGVRGLVVVRDGPLSAFLRASENPSHTKWNAKPVKDTYLYAPGTMNYVVDAVRHLAELLAGDPTEKDASVWADDFKLPDGSDLPTPGTGTRGGRKGPKKTSKEDDGTIKLPPGRKLPFEIGIVQGGFTVRPSDQPFLLTSLPVTLRFQMAYHVRGRNPLDRWNLADFDLADPDQFNHQGQGCAVEELDGNQLVIRIEQPDFSFKITGFDPRRELFLHKPRVKNALPTAREDDESGDDGTDEPASSSANPGNGGVA